MFSVTGGAPSSLSSIAPHSLKSTSKSMVKWCIASHDQCHHYEHRHSTCPVTRLLLNPALRSTRHQIDEFVARHSRRYDSCMAARLPVLCIFRSTRTDHSDEEYRAWSEEMDELVTSTPGYVRHYSFRDEQSREGVTISYFDDDDSIIEWKSAARHQEAQQRGRDTFYSNYSIDIAHVVRHYDWGTSPSSTS
jgi:heme-degrading monooxygenase HmoA